MKTNKLFFLGKLLVCILLVTYLNSCSKLNEGALNIDAESGCKASECHPSTVLKKALPDSGVHTKHIKKGITCLSCHEDYLNNDSHKDGKVDTNTNKKIVYFNNTNIKTSWDNSSGKCLNIVCHQGGEDLINRLRKKFLNKNINKAVADSQADAGWYSTITYFRKKH